MFYSVITVAIQRLEWLSRVNYIIRADLEACLWSCSTLSSLVRLLCTSEYDLWVREMMITGLDFKNPVGIETFNCFKRVCIIERNTTECSRPDPVPKEGQQNTGVKKMAKIHVTLGPAPKPWNPPPGLKFPCPLANRKHEVSTCAEFFNLSPLHCWEQIEKGRMFFLFETEKHL